MLEWCLEWTPENDSISKGNQTHIQSILVSMIHPVQVSLEKKKNSCQITQEIKSLYIIKKNQKERFLIFFPPPKVKRRTERLSCCCCCLWLWGLSLEARIAMDFLVFLARNWWWVFNWISGWMERLLIFLRFFCFLFGCWENVGFLFII